MGKLRVMVVDDAAVMRRLLTAALQNDPGIEVCDTAPNGRIALTKIARSVPDLVTLDVEMPELDGLATLREIRKNHPRLPVIMVSASTSRGAAATLDALAAGASDYLAKPSEVSNLQQAIISLRQDLLPKVKAHCGVLAQPAPTLRRPRPTSRQPLVSSRPFDLLCISTSTGGPNALAQVFQDFSRPCTIPVAIVQHMPPMFTRMLAERLNGIGGPLSCVEAADGDIMQPGTAYLAPGGRHLTIRRGGQGQYIARLQDTPPENSCRPAADVMLRSAVATGAHILSVVMTGMGYDGMHGCESVNDAGGRIMIQDEASSVVWGMPGAIASSDLPHTIHGLDQLAGDVERQLAQNPLAVA